MLGVTVDFDAKVREQVISILHEYGLINDKEITREEAEKALFEKLDKSHASGASPHSHEEIWAKFNI